MQPPGHVAPSASRLWGPAWSGHGHQRPISEPLGHLPSRLCRGAGDADPHAVEIHVRPAKGAHLATPRAVQAGAERVCVQARVPCRRTQAGSCAERCRGQWAASGGQCSAAGITGTTAHVVRTETNKLMIQYTFVAIHHRGDAQTRDSIQIFLIFYRHLTNSRFRHRAFQHTKRAEMSHNMHLEQ